MFFYNKLLVMHFFTRADGVRITIMESMAKAVQFTCLCFVFFLISNEIT